MDSIMVKGVNYEIHNPYVEGHECTKGEADYLFGGRRKRADLFVRKQLKNGSDPDEIQTNLDAYMSRFQFGQRATGIRKPKDPIAVKALELAKDHIRKKFKQAGGRLKDLKTGKLNAKAREWVADADRGYLELAKKELKKAAPQVAIDDDIADLLLS